MRIPLFFIIVLNVLFIGCDPYADELKPYNPVLAGATIVDIYNITGQVKFEKKYFEGLIKDYYDLAIYNDKIYIRTYDVLYIFGKITFSKIGEIKIKFLYRPGIQYFENDGLVILDDNTGFLLCKMSGVSEKYLYSLDLNTGDALLVEDLDQIGIEKSKLEGIGYDKENDSIWFSTFPITSGNIYYCLYNTYNQSFSVEKKINKFFTTMALPSIFISGDKLFYTGYSYTDPSRKYKTNIGVERYSISDPTERQHFINAEYLGTKTVPQEIIYDKPYIWMMVERDNQIQMLKLLPNE